jgi:hypothetical protein
LRLTSFTQILRALLDMEEVARNGDDIASSGITAVISPFCKNENAKVSAKANELVVRWTKLVKQMRCSNSGAGRSTLSGGARCCELASRFDQRRDTLQCGPTTEQSEAKLRKRTHDAMDGEHMHSHQLDPKRFRLVEIDMFAKRKLMYVSLSHDDGRATKARKLGNIEYARNRGDLWLPQPFELLVDDPLAAALSLE